MKIIEINESNVSEYLKSTVEGNYISLSKSGYYFISSELSQMIISTPAIGEIIIVNAENSDCFCWMFGKNYLAQNLIIGGFALSSEALAEKPSFFQDLLIYNDSFPQVIGQIPVALEKEEENAISQS